MKLIKENDFIPKLGDTQDQKDPIVYIKLFHPFSNWAWYVLEYDPVDRVCFGLVCAFESELGYFSIDEIEGVLVKGIPVERDEHWTPVKVSEVSRVVRR